MESGCICKSLLPQSPCWDLFSVAAETNSPVKIVQGSKVSCKHCFTLHLYESLFWLSRNLHKQSSVINFTLLFNGNLYTVPIQHKPGSDDVGTVLKDIWSAGKPIVLLWDEPNVKHWFFAKLGYMLGNRPSSVTNTDSGILWVGSAWVPELL